VSGENLVNPHRLIPFLIRKFGSLFLNTQKDTGSFCPHQAMIRAESGFNPQAVSRRGARGLMRLMPETALRMKVSNAFDQENM
jgi:membrane-bound lytic murein transglycosylase MltF